MMTKRKTARPVQKFSWKAGASAFKKLDPQAVGEELERLRQSNGGALDAENVITAAEDPTSAMHEAFPWDDQEAARQYRLEVARRLLRSVTVTIITPKQEEIEIRAFVATPKPNEPRRSSYTSTEYAMNDPDLRAEVLKQALRELAAIRRKYSELSELAVVFAAIQKVEKAA